MPDSSWLKLPCYYKKMVCFILDLSFSEQFCGMNVAMIQMETIDTAKDEQTYMISFSMNLGFKKRWAITNNKYKCWIYWICC